MKPFLTAETIALLGLIAASPATAAPPEAPVAVEVRGVSPEIARAINRQASQGKTALIKYLERGRFVYEVRVEEAPKDAKGSEQPTVIANTR